MQRRVRIAFVLPLVVLALAFFLFEFNPPQARTLDVSKAPFTVTEVGQFDDPWSMVFLPDGRALVGEKPGHIKVWDPKKGVTGEIAGVPEVRYCGQAGFADIALHPKFSENHIIYFSYAQADPESGSAETVARAKLVLDANGGGRLEDQKIIWQQNFRAWRCEQHSGRLLFSPDGHLFIASGERFQFTPAQDLKSNLGKIIRLTDDGKTPPDNPFADKGPIAAQVWTLGHRNPLGIAFDKDGRLWENEMGPMGGDEFNLIEKGKNYGWPVVSEGDHYDGTRIPRHKTHPEFEPPKIEWTPIVAPAGMIIYSGDQFPAWKGNALIPCLASQALIRIELNGTTAKEVERYVFDHRLRGIQQGPDGAIYVFEDLTADADGGRLLKLMPRK